MQSHRPLQPLRPRLYSEHFSNTLLPMPSGHAPISSASSSVADVPMLHYSLFYDIQLHILRVTIGEVSALKHPHNCYITLYLHPDKRVVKETKVVSKSDNPEFNQMFEFRGVIPGDLPTRVLVAAVMSREKFSRNALLGMAVVAMESANVYGSPSTAEVDTMATSTEVSVH